MGRALRTSIRNDPQFSWLLHMSHMIVTLRQKLEAEAPDRAADVNGILAQARQLVSPDETGTGYALRYDAALQDSPDAVFAHRDVIALLKGRKDETLPPQRTH